eukprot:scaffold324_cov394-Prasinococcus_capsulatus_cf.AAC.19
MLVGFIRYVVQHFVWRLDAKVFHWQSVTPAWYILSMQETKLIYDHPSGQHVLIKVPHGHLTSRMKLRYSFSRMDATISTRVMIPVLMRRGFGVSTTMFNNGFRWP